MMKIACDASPYLLGYRYRERDQEEKAQLLPNGLSDLTYIYLNVTILEYYFLKP